MRTYFIESGKLASIENLILDTSKNISLIVHSDNRLMIQSQIKNHKKSNLHYDRKIKLQVVRCDDNHNVISIDVYE